MPEGLAKFSRKEKQMAIQDRVHTINFWRLPLVGAVATVLVLLLAFALSSCIRAREPEMEAGAPTTDPAAQLASGDVDALERSQFVAGPEDVALEPVGAVFEGGVELVAAGVLDDPRPEGALRLALDWRVAERVDDSLAVFVHLVCDESRLIAQRDAVPGNGLFPVESWEPGEVVRDQFVLQLPPELPAGAYEIQVGVYSATSGQRYSLVEPAGGTCVVVQQFAIEE
jgi:hypothetical protein